MSKEDILFQLDEELASDYKNITRGTFNRNKTNIFHIYH
jgi:hypothetical protein